MKKNQTVQGTFSKLFGKKHANAAATSLYATNPPWIFTQEAPEEGTRDFDGIYYGDNRFDTVSESGTATLKARPRVRPLLTFLPLNAQENHGLAVPTPSVPEDFADKEFTGTSSLVNGNLRLYSSVGDLRPGHYGPDPPIPPPPPGPAPGPPQDTSPPPEESHPPPPPFTAPPPPPLLLEPPPPPSTAPPPPPVLDTLSPSSTLSPPSTPTPPDFIPPAPPLVFLDPPPPSLPAPTPPAPLSPHTMGTHLFPPRSVTKWKSEVALNGRQPEAPQTSPPRSPAELKGNPLGPNPEPHLTFPRSFKVPPPTPVRTSSIPVQEAQGAPLEEEGGTKKAPNRLPLPPSFHVRPAFQVYPDKASKPDGSRELRTEAPDSLKLPQSQALTNGQAGTPPPASPLSPPAPLAPPPAPPLPPPAPPLPSVKQAAPPFAGFTKSPKSSSPALKPTPKPKPPSPEDTASSEPVDWWEPTQMEKLRSELSAYLCGSRREERSLSHRPGPTVALQDKEGKKGPDLPEEAAPPNLPAKVPPGAPEKNPNCTSLPEREAANSLPLPPVDYLPQDSPGPSVRQIRNELEARFALSAEKEAKPSGSLPPKPRPEGRRILENGTDHGKFFKPVAKNPPPLSTPPLPATPLQSKATSGPATPPKATTPKATPGPATPPKATPGQAMLSTATILPTTSSQLMAEKDFVPGGLREKPEPQEGAGPSQLGTEEALSEATRLPTPGACSSPALPPKTSPSREEVPFLYKPHRSQNSPGREVAVVMPTLARGEATGSGGPVDKKEPQDLPAKPPAPVQPDDQLLRHPVTGEVVERGSPMALLLAARQRAQKGRCGGAALGRSSLPGSLHGHSGQPEASSDSIFYTASRPNSFLVVPKAPSEAEKDSQPTSTARPTVPSQWTPQRGRGPQAMEPTQRHKWTKVEPKALVAWERPAPSSHPQGHQLPKSFSSPPSPSYKREEEEEEKEFSFEVIPPPPEFSNDPEPPAPALQYRGRQGSPPRNSFPDVGQPLDVGPAAPPALGFSRFTRARYAGAGGPERFSGAGRSLIKKRLYVGEPLRHPGTPRSATGRSLSSPNCFGPQPGGPFGAPGGPEMRRVNSVGRAPPSGLQARRMSLEGGARAAGEAKYKAPGSGDCGCAPATGRSPHGTAHYGSPINNTFTVRPGTRHPISYAYSGAHRKATS